MDAELHQLLHGFGRTHIDRVETDADGLASLRLRPRTVVILDNDVPTLGGLAFLGDTRHQKLRAQVLMLGQQAEITDVLRALRAGAAGYLRQTASAGELIQAVARIAGGGRYLEADVAQTLALQFIGNLRFPSPKHRLRDDAGDDGCARL